MVFNYARDLMTGDLSKTVGHYCFRDRLSWLNGFIYFFLVKSIYFSNEWMIWAILLCDLVAMFNPYTLCDTEWLCRKSALFCNFYRFMLWYLACNLAILWLWYLFAYVFFMGFMWFYGKGLSNTFYKILLICLAFIK